MSNLTSIVLLAIVLLCGAGYVRADTDRSAPTVAGNAAADAIPPIVEIDDRVAFDGAYPHARRLDFAGAIGKTAPFKIGPVGFSGGNAQVLDTLVDLPADYWFGAQTTSPDFLLANLTVQVTFPWPVQAAGFDVQCFACDVSGQPTPFTAALLDANGMVVGYEESFLSTLTGVPQSTPAFLGFDSDTPFTSMILHRDGNWMMMNLRYQPTERKP